MKIALLFFLIFTVLVVWAEGHTPTKMELSASSDMDALRTWKDLDAWRKKYAPIYDDGFYAEGLSDFVERKLTTDWRSLNELVSLSDSSPGLFEFAIGHLGEITNCASANSIVGNAISNCPSGLQSYCKHIQDALVPGASPECLPTPNPALQRAP